MSALCSHRQPAPLTRRDFLQQLGAGLGTVALASILHEQNVRADEPRLHHPARAKAVIQLFMLGGASQCDTFDYKPELIRRHGQTVPFRVTGGTAAAPGPVLKSPWTWRRHGQSGRWVTNALPHMAECVDDMAFLMAMYAPTSEHSAGQTMQVSGFVTPGFPTVGAWVSYALGSLNRNLPTFVALPDPVGLPWTGQSAWNSGFLPAAHQATMLNPAAENPVPDLFPARDGRFVTPESEREGLDLLSRLNRQQLERAAGDSRLEARIRSYELAARMQLAVPEVLELRDETEPTRRLYGLDNPRTRDFGRNCLIARRLIERGVRFIQLWCGSGLNGASGNWDSHGDVRPGSDFERMCLRCDKPIAGLLKDLKRRGLLDETVVFWTSEFGRTPFNNSADAKGREHHPWAFASWLAGAGVKPGVVHGTTDEYGIRVAEDGVHVHDFHATILHLLGLNHEKLTYRYAGRDFRLTDVGGEVVYDVLA